MTDQSGPFEALLALQDEDLHADQLRHRIDHHPLALEIKALHDQSLALERSTTQIRLEYDGLTNQQNEIEVEVVDIDRRIEEIDQRLRGEASGSFRDQTAMSNEMGALAERKRTIEDAELAIMEELDPLEAQITKVKAEQATLRARAVELHREMVRDQEKLNVALTDVLAKRDEIVRSVEQPLLGEYEKLRSHLGGVGAARLVHGMCSGCNLALSPTELDKLKHTNAAELVHCDQCGRILVP
jgi:hypothetical protein